MRAMDWLLHGLALDAAIAAGVLMVGGAAIGVWVLFVMLVGLGRVDDEKPAE